MDDNDEKFLDTGITPGEIASAVHNVRRAQSFLASDRKGLNLASYADRENFRTVAQDLGRHFFPQTYKKQLTSTIAQVEEAYKYALVLFPYLQRIKGTYRPSWSRGVLLSWFRRSVTTFTRQWWFARILLNGPAEPERAVQNVKEILGIRDTVWLEEAFRFLDNLSLSEGLKAELAKTIYYPAAFAHIDAEYARNTRFDAIPRERKILRALKKGTVGYLRRGTEIWMVADRYAHRTIDEAEWIDSRENTFDILDYRLTYRAKGKKGGLHIEILPERIDEIIAEVKSVLWTDNPPAKKMYQINGLMMNFSTTHKYATGAGRQLFHLDRAVYRLVREKILPTYQKGRELFWSPKGKLDMKLIKPIVSPFHDPAGIDETLWRQIWNPYR